MDNKKIKESLILINTLLGNITVSGESVFHLSDCRKALSQIITQIPVDEKEE